MRASVEIKVRQGFSVQTEVNHDVCKLLLKAHSSSLLQFYLLLFPSVFYFKEKKILSIFYELCSFSYFVML